MRNRPEQQAETDPAGHAGRERALDVSGLFLPDALRPAAFLVDQAWTALRPMLELLGLDDWRAASEARHRR